MTRLKTRSASINAGPYAARRVQQREQALVGRSALPVNLKMIILAVKERAVHVACSIEITSRGAANLRYPPRALRMPPTPADRRWEAQRCRRACRKRPRVRCDMCTAAGGTPYHVVIRELAKPAGAEHESREVLRAQLRGYSAISSDGRGKDLSLRCRMYRRFAQ